MSTDRGVPDLLAISKLGFGAASIGNLYAAVSDAEADAALQAAWDSGIRYFDTAPHYGLGLSERRLGRFLATKPREEYVVSTKVGRLLEPNPHFVGGNDLEQLFDVPNDLRRRFDPTAAGVRQSLHDSLERLGLDSVDVLYLHDPEVYDLDLGLSEGLPALAGLRSEGLVRAIGVGVNHSDVATRAIEAGDLDLVMIAGRYTLVDQTAADDLLPAAVAAGVGVVAAAVFNSGLLAKPNPQPDATFDYSTVSQEVLGRAQEIAMVCTAFGVDLPTAALQFPLRHPAVVSVVVGTARSDAVEQNAARMAEPIPEQLWSELTRRGLVRPESIVSEGLDQQGSAQPRLGGHGNG